MVAGSGVAEFSEPYVARNPGVWKFIRYLRQFFKLRRRDPRNDLVSALIKAEEGEDKLDENEYLAMVFLLLIAGHETTVNQQGAGFKDSQSDTASMGC